MEDDNPERRRSARLDYHSRITIENLEVGVVHEARMGNYSRTGLYFESDFFLVPGTEIFIGIANSPFPSGTGLYECYRAVVRWRNQLEESSCRYGYGVELKSRLAHRRRPGTDGEARRGKRRPCAIPTVIECQGKRYRGEIRSASPGGVFIRCSENLAVGRIVYLTIPLKNRRKLVTRVGKVVWCEADGIGIEFAPNGP
jgi:hypothetical protein